MRRSIAVASAILTVAGLGISTVAGADNDRGKPVRVRATLTGYSEVAISATTTTAQSGTGLTTAVTTVGAISTTGRGTFRADIDEASGVISYTLKYSDLTGDVRQAHLHFGQHHTAGGISAWLCQTTANRAPAGQENTPTCAPEVSGTIMAANVIGPAGQGIAAGEFAELVAAIRAGVVYVNVHSSAYPAGEIRGQLF